MRTLIAFGIALAVGAGIVAYFAGEAVRTGMRQASKESRGHEGRESGNTAPPEAQAATSRRTNPELRRDGKRDSEPSTVSGRDSESEAQATVGAPPTEGDNASTPDSPTGTADPRSGAVHWADAGSPAAERRLRTARATLRHEPMHEAALRDEAAALAELGRWREAEASLRKLVAIRPDDNELRFDWAAALLRLRSHFEAADALKSVVASDPNHDRAWFNLAVAHQSLGRLEDALSAWNRAIALRPTVAARLQRGTLLLDLHEFAAAADDFEWVLARGTLSVDASHNLATAYRRLGRYDEARRALAAVLDLKPRHVPTINRLAEIAWEQSQQPGADAEALVRETIERCIQSLEIDASQADVVELKAAAEARLARLAPPGQTP